MEAMTTRPAQRRYLASSPFNFQPQPVIERFAVGDRVTHERYGLGRVIGEEPEAVIVEFGADRVRVTSPFHKLTEL